MVVRRLLAALLITVSSTAAQAKVSVNAWLCFAQQQLSLDESTQSALSRLVARARDVERHYGSAETVLVATYLPERAKERPAESNARAAGILQRLRDIGLTYQEPVVMAGAPVDSRDRDCRADQAVLEIEILFKHP